MFLIADFTLGSCPDGLYQVDSFSVDGDGEIDEIGVLLHYLLDLGLLYELLLVLFDVQDDPSPPAEALLLDLLHLESTRTVRRPFVCWTALLSRSNLHQIRHDEC